MLNNHHEYYIEKLVYFIVFLSCLTYAGTFEVVVRIFPAEFLFFFVLLPLLIIKKKSLLSKMDNSLNIISGIFVLIHIISLIIVTISLMDLSFISKGFKEVFRVFLTVPFLLIVTYLYRLKIISVYKIIESFVYSGIFCALYGIYQFVSFKIFGKYIYLLPGSSEVPNINGRGVGTFYEGGYAVLFLGLAFGFLLFLQKERNTFSRQFYIAYISILLIGIFVTESTAGYVALFLSILCYIFLEILRKKSYRNISTKQLTFALLVAGIFIYITYHLFSVKIDALINGLFILSVNGIEGFQHGIGDFSAEDRMVKTLKAISMFLSSPLVGIGIGQYGMFYHDFLPASLTNDVGTVVPLNVYAELLGELGIVGILSFLFLVSYLFIKGSSLTRSIIIFLLLNLIFYPSYKMIFIWITFLLVYLIPIEQKARANK